MRNRHPVAAVSAALAATLATGGCTASALGGGAAGGSPSSGTDCVRIVEENGKKTDECLPLAPERERVDRGTPVFSHPTEITNPLHASSRIQQVIYDGQVDEKPFRTELTLLPDIKTITVNGEQVRARTLQYVSFSDGRVQEVATDWFAQADDGSVWYLGEDVFNYENGVVENTGGTWRAGKTGPAAMIMPNAPKAGDVYRPENSPGTVFEEVTVKAVGQTVPGPYGPVEGAMRTTEINLDGTREDKVIAPGYGELTIDEPGTDLEAITLAVPTDVTPGPVPSELAALSAAVRTAHAEATDATVAKVRAAWDAYRAADRVPQLLARQMDRDLDSLTAAVKARDGALVRGAVLRVAQNDLDLHLRHQPLATVEAARMALWARQATLDGAARDAGAIAGDATSLELTWDRVRHGKDAARAARIDAALKALREAADRKDASAAQQATARLMSAL
ncbi:hypothetical protein [Streptomyces sp. TLI_105]|uniref:hypothetical protein n=1 Tax=Streptomyces sp. TLI_105 TaxID=1881019 RepID=UPI00089A9158|nr:hypothetical protein [Streptomyces sp. TLI_105]SEC09445.1 hypothetical protein SAMN05428939_1546 [Streptomyces sp. TLI_105]